MSRSAEIRSQLSHPVVDADGHWLESTPLLLDALYDSGGASAVDAYRRHQKVMSDFYKMTPEELINLRPRRVAWWCVPSNTLDRATGMLPALLRERLEEFGLDLAIMYPTIGIMGLQMQDEDYRRAFCRAMNVLAASMFSPYQDCLIPVALIPTFSPEEAIDELRYASRELHLKVAVIAGSSLRPIGGAGAQAGPTTNGFTSNGLNSASYVDNLVLDSTQDFDPLWAEFCNLKFAVTTHIGSGGWPDRRSSTNFTFNHLGHFAQANHNFARAVLLAGVTRRFPDLKFAFLEGGVGWAVNLYVDLLAHCRTRGEANLLANLRPSNLDIEDFKELFVKYGGADFEGRFDEVLESSYAMNPNVSIAELTERDLTEHGGPFEDFGAADVKGEGDLQQRYADSFYFGCEADDPMTAWAYDRRIGANLRPVFSSDIGHFDVPNMNEVLEEAFELVEDGYLNEEQFREFTFSNAVSLHGSLDSDFFVGTAVEDEAREVLSAKSVRH
jgi:predicted TIM-barrel fold metal-dependent hydrolase